eukprot:3520800-Prymnesium_polylepis.1
MVARLASWWDEEKERLAAHVRKVTYVRNAGAPSRPNPNPNPNLTPNPNPNQGDLRAQRGCAGPPRAEAICARGRRARAVVPT